MIVSLVASLALGSPIVGLTIQKAASELAPPEIYALGGYTARGGRKMDPGGEPLWCRVVVFGGESRLVIASVEMLTIPESLVSEVRKLLPEDVRLFLCATHTHCAPDSQMLNSKLTVSVPGIAKFDPKALEWYASSIAASINKALDAEPSIRDHLILRSARLNLNRGRRRLADPIQTALQLRSGESVLFNSYAAHATLWGPERNQTSGDWPGEVSRRTSALTLIGPIGDVSPASTGPTPERQIQSFADQFLNGMKGAKSEQIATSPVRVSEVPIALDPPVPSPFFAKEFGAPEPLVKSLVTLFAPKEAVITGFRIGKLAVIGVPGEPSSSLGRKIRDEGIRRGFRHVLVVSHVNGWIGYILEPDDAARGGYEAALNFHGPLTSSKVLNAAYTCLDQLALPASSARFARKFSTR